MRTMYLSGPQLWTAITGSASKPRPESLLQFLKRNDIPHEILPGEQRNRLRVDHKYLKQAERALKAEKAAEKAVRLEKIAAQASMPKATRVPIRAKGVDIGALIDLLQDLAAKVEANTAAVNALLAKEQA